MESENPYAVQGAGNMPPGSPSARSRLSPGILSQIRVVAILMIVHGTLLLFLGGGLVLLGALFPTMMTAQSGTMKVNTGELSKEQFSWLLLIVYGGLGLLVSAVAFLQIVAGIYNLALKKRMLGIVAVSVGTLSILTCYCAPTSLALLVYCLVIYLHDTSKQAFALREQGYTWKEIENLARDGV
jgi:hypothetical protein